MSVLSLIVLLGLVTYRVTRFIIEDSLIDTPRDWALRKVPNKLEELLTCKFCLSIWVAAGVVAITDAFTSVPLPVWVWLATAAAALIAWRVAED